MWDNEYQSPRQSVRQPSVELSFWESACRNQRQSAQLTQISERNTLPSSSSRYLVLPSTRVAYSGSMSKANGDTAPVVTNNNNDNDSHHPTTDAHDLAVKSEFILSQRDASLPTLGVASDDDRHPTMTTTTNEDASHSKNKHHRGRNKKRPRDEKMDPSLKLCLSIVRGQHTCNRGESCKFSHDLALYCKTRPQDLQPVLLTTTIPSTPLTLTCPHYALYGSCPYGIMCRLGSQHTTKDGHNVIKEQDTDNPSSSSSVLLTAQSNIANVLPKDLQVKLRKRKFQFHYQAPPKNNNNNNNNNNGNDDSDTKETSQTTTSTTTPPPTSMSGTSSSSSSSLRPIRLIDFSNKVYVAPLTTVGNLPFRRICKQLGADITCGEMALCTNLLQGKPSEWALLKRHVSEDVFGIQLAGGFPDVLSKACEVIQKANCQVEFIDVNLGCPIDLVCNKGAGAALMLREKRLQQAIAGMTQSLQATTPKGESCPPVTIKMRTGWDSNKPIAESLVRKIQTKWTESRQGIGAIMIHGRSRLQRYSKDADWDYIQQVASVTRTQAPSSLNDNASPTTDTDNKNAPEETTEDTTADPGIPVIGNGDLFSYVDYEEKVLSRQPYLSSCAMLARGALIKPWLPTEIKERRHWDISASERLDILKDFVNFGLEHWGSDQQGVNNTRRFLLEWLSFLHRYVPVGMLEVLPQQMNQRPPVHMKGRNDLETLFLSSICDDWIKISEMLLGPVPEGFKFAPKHKANSYHAEG